MEDLTVLRRCSGEKKNREKEVRLLMILCRRSGYGVLRQLENEGRDEMKEVNGAGK
ncbi:hypothetical protein HAX54_036031, partial [Datura stramonium]|nr:hypothetical protein [Datura stramonium]